jgi:hypothetical protein
MRPAYPVKGSSRFAACKQCGEVCVLQNAATVFDAQPRAIAEWSLESPVIRNGHAGFGMDNVSNYIDREGGLAALGVLPPAVLTTNRLSR